ncbi:MAG: creatininase family protein [Acidimicrobiia bacterium]
MTARLLSELRGPQIAELLTDRSVIVQPLGSIEQHGPHLPFSTDYDVADAAAKAAMQEYGEDLDLWMLPTLAMTKSNEHAWSAGTMWLSAETLLKVLSDIARCVAMTPAKRLVFLNGHGGNTAMLNVACREARLEHGLMTFLTHPGGPPRDHGGAAPANDELGMGVHGGIMETSVMLHLRPDLVDMSVAVRNVPEHMAKNKYVKFGGAVAFGWLSNDFGPLGHIGDPTGATAELGKERFEASVHMLGEAFAEIREFRF